jgi:hypothetical protein
VLKKAAAEIKAADAESRVCRALSGPHLGRHAFSQLSSVKHISDAEKSAIDASIRRWGFLH